MFASWETSARYAWNRTRFTLTIPIFSSHIPHNLHIKYDNTAKCLKVYGNYAENIQSPIYANTPLSLQRKHDDTLPPLYYQRLVEENGKPELRFSECCPKK